MYWNGNALPVIHILLFYRGGGERGVGVKKNWKWWHYSTNLHIHTHTHHTHAERFNLIRLEIQYNENILEMLLHRCREFVFFLFRIKKNTRARRMRGNYFKGILLLIKLFPFCKIKFVFLSLVHFYYRFLLSDMENVAYIERVWYIKWHTIKIQIESNTTTKRIINPF